MKNNALNDFGNSAHPDSEKNQPFSHNKLV